MYKKLLDGVELLGMFESIRFIRGLLCAILSCWRGKHLCNGFNFSFFCLDTNRGTRFSEHQNKI